MPEWDEAWEFPELDYVTAFPLTMGYLQSKVTSWSFVLPSLTMQESVYVEPLVVDTSAFGSGLSTVYIPLVPAHLNEPFASWADFAFKGLRLILLFGLAVYTATGMFNRIREFV